MCWSVMEGVGLHAEVLHTCVFNAKHSQRFFETFLHVFAAQLQSGQAAGS